MPDWQIKALGIVPLILAVASYTVQNSKTLLELALILAFTTMLAYIVYEIMRKARAILGI